MPAPGIMALAAMLAIGYLYVGKPVAHGVKKASHAVCHVASLGHKCGSKKATP